MRRWRRVSNQRSCQRQSWFGLGSIQRVIPTVNTGERLDPISGSRCCLDSTIYQANLHVWHTVCMPVSCARPINRSPSRCIFERRTEDRRHRGRALLRLRRRSASVSVLRSRLPGARRLPAVAAPAARAHSPSKGRPFASTLAAHRFRMDPIASAVASVIHRARCALSMPMTGLPVCPGAHLPRRCRGRPAQCGSGPRGSWLPQPLESVVQRFVIRVQSGALRPEMARA